MKAPKVEDRVQATAAAAMGKKLATQRYGANAKAKKLSGEIIASDGSGRKWRVRWDDDKIGESVHSSRVLENAESVEDIEDAVVINERDSDEELPSEELAEAEPEMEEGGEPTSDPLVVKGIKWTIVDNLVDIRYIPKQRGHMLWNRTQQLDSESNRREVDYFLWSFPDKAVAEILECTTNSMLTSKPSSIPVSRGELFKLLSFLLALTRTHLTTSISVEKKVTIHLGPFVWMSLCLHGVEKMEIFVAMACHMLQRYLESPKEWVLS